MNKIILLLSVAIISNAFAIPNRRTPSNMTPEERAAKRAEMQKKMLQQTGGIIARPETQKGEIVYVNCQNSAKEIWLFESAKYFSEQTKFKVSVKNGAFDFPYPKIQGEVSIFIIDDNKLPPLLVAPESRWAMVNMAQLKIGKGEKPAFLEARTRKQLSRAFAHLCGGIGSRYPGSAACGITKVEDLDKIMELRLPLDIIQRFKEYMGAFGVSPAEYVPYRKAVIEGWASSPTNEYQKAVWDKVHAMPTAPIKIKPETKKVRE